MVPYKGPTLCARLFVICGVTTACPWCRNRRWGGSERFVQGVEYTRHTLCFSNYSTRGANGLTVGSPREPSFLQRCFETKAFYVLSFPLLFFFVCVYLVRHSPPPCTRTGCVGHDTHEIRNRVDTALALSGVPAPRTHASRFVPQRLRTTCRMPPTLPPLYHTILTPHRLKQIHEDGRWRIIFRARPGEGVFPGIDSTRFHPHHGTERPQHGPPPDPASTVYARKHPVPILIFDPVRIGL